MKKLLMMIVLFLAACSYEVSLAELKEQYPKAVKEKIAELPEKIQQQLTIPNQLPFQPTYVNFGYETVSAQSDGITRTEFLISNQEANLHVVHWYTELRRNDDQNHRIMTINEREVMVLSDKERVKQLQWEESDGSTMVLSLIISEKATGKYTLNDLVEAAKSMPD
ncbi:hypothetical protein [Halobacillus naozhouensis]|uniref:DUF4367 domain-containing protein n=1 Tax=Halobacillus naozhouensis TaxID=554880 RepID=A0ABY8J371_9BACI|nr:hypothetical protein [Halobacillus naozhouensis]WFT75879.1 hypothetical protein P9989_05715 [Halobacillus naozhouensis]